jgi:hypothetical protein
MAQERRSMAADSRPRRERPRGCRAAEQREELAATNVDCHVTLPREVMPMQWRDHITL